MSTMIRPKTTSRLLGTALASLLLGACGGEGNPTPIGDGTQAVQEAKSDKPHDSSPVVAKASYDALLAGNSALAFDLYHQLSEAKANFFCSPLSVSVALAMTYAGAKGDTATQMAQALHFTLPQTELHPAFNKLTIDLASRNVAPHETQEGTKTVRVDLSNAAWAQQDYSFVPAYLDVLAVSYDAGVKLLDFTSDPPGSTKIINEWVEDKTEGKIKDLIPDGALTPLTRLVLTNTLYFYGNWATVFEKEATQDGAFHAPAGDVTAAIMHAGLTVQYAEDTDWQMADIPYDGGKLVMTVVLPADGKFEAVRSGLTDTWLASADQKMTSTSIELGLPKFRYEWGTMSLTKALEALGMTDAFDDTKADFTGMEPTGELYIADVLHKAFVGVDESGTEAAAATAVIMAGNAGPGATMEIDRPFLFLIRDSSNGMILFVGQVVDPSAS